MSVSLVKVVTKKLADFQGKEQEFSNVYYFGDGNLTNPDEATVTTLVNQVLTAEKLIFNSSTRFLGGLGYVGWETPGDTAALANVEYSATGHQGSATGTAVYRECAIDIKWLLGGRRYLRSMLHTGIGHGLDVSGAGSAGTVSASVLAFGDKMLGSTHFAPFRRMAPNGDVPSAFQVTKWLEHRQFHRYRVRED